MKKIITIFILPNEIELYEKLMVRLRKSLTLSGDGDFFVDATLSVSDQMVDWKNSLLSKEDIIKRFTEASTLPGDYYVDEDGEIMGCVSKRRESWLKYPDAQSFTWIDCDFYFPIETFAYISYGIKALQTLKVNNFILTPQYVKIWDSTWDELVNENFINKPYGYFAGENNHPDYDAERDAKYYGQPELQRVNNFKIGGGWLTTISKTLLDEITIPKSFGHYGEEDTFIMVVAQNLVKRGHDIQQYVIKNIVAAQSGERLNIVKQYDRRKEFRKIALDNFGKELNLKFN